MAFLSGWTRFVEVGVGRVWIGLARSLDRFVLVSSSFFPLCLSGNHGGKAGVVVHL